LNERPSGLTFDVATLYQDSIVLPFTVPVGELVKRCVKS
jgi:hypothetical protein